MFLENRDGGPFFRLLRVIKRFKSMRKIPLSQYKNITYLTPWHLRAIKEIFPVVKIQQTLFPPIYLIVAQKALNKHVHIAKG